MRPTLRQPPRRSAHVVTRSATGLTSRAAIVGALMALVVLAMPVRAPAATSATLVVPGHSIGGVALGMTRAKVTALRPLGGAVSTSRETIDGVPILSQRFGNPSKGIFVVVFHGRSRSARATLISAGMGPWHTRSGVKYGMSALHTFARLDRSPRIYNVNGGQREYADSGNTGIAELKYGENWMYLTFNPDENGDHEAGFLAGFTMSANRIYP